jgi:tetratricopeptide (TPR) repeat protein
LRSFLEVFVTQGAKGATTGAKSPAGRRRIFGTYDAGRGKVRPSSFLAALRVTKGLAVMAPVVLNGRYVRAYLIVLVSLKLWMFLDARRRGMSATWLVAILCVPFAEVVYFVGYKLPEFHGAIDRATADTAEEQLARLAAKPTLENLLGAAHALSKEKRQDEAIVLFERAVQQSPENPEAWHGLAHAITAERGIAKSVPAYEKLTAIDPRYADFRAAEEYAEALFSAGRRTEALELFEALLGQTGRPKHALAYAEGLWEEGQRAPALEVLTQARRKLDTTDEAEADANGETEADANGIAERLEARLDEYRAALGTEASSMSEEV